MEKRIPNTQTGSLTNNQDGTNDTLIWGAYTANVIYGDALNMSGNSHGGNDTLIGDAFKVLVGDAGTMRNHSHGGNDTLIGSIISMV